MKTYEFLLRHDSGTVRLRYSDDNLEAARRRVLSDEKAPESAIISWSVVPTAKEIRKTKNLLRGI